MSDPVTSDFIFGTLATDELRLEALRAAGRGLHHGNRVEPPDPAPGDRIVLTVSAGAEVDPAEVTLWLTLDGSEPDDNAQQIAFERGSTEWDTLLWAYRQHWRATLPPQPADTHVRYRIAARTPDGQTLWAEPDPISGVPATFGFVVDQARVPDWARDAVIYHIFVDRFEPGAGRAWSAAPTLNDFNGGTLRGVIERLPYLEQLGVSCVWLSPVFPSPSHHGYDATDYRSVEPRLGSDDDLRELFEQAHRLGMRVLLDFVANHVSDQHPAFAAARGSADAAEHGWFSWQRWPDAYRSFFGVETMPQVDNGNQAARAYMIDAARYWLAQGADGFRLDYANGPSHAFWSAFRAATRAEHPESFTVGEVVESAELQRSYVGRLDGVLDFLLLQQLRAFFAFETSGARAFDAFLQRHLAYFPTDFVVPSFLDNHDMNRFLWVVRGDKRRLKLAALCQFTLPYPPIVYYGTEVGLSQRHDLEYPDGSRKMEESRMPMPWGTQQDAGLLAFYRRLIALRRADPSLWRGSRQTLEIRDEGLLVTEIQSATGRAVVALNRTAAEQTVEVPFGSLALATDDGVTLANGVLGLPAYSGAALRG